MSDPTVVLVHGAFAESASWNDVVERLQARGLRVVAADVPAAQAAVMAATQRPAADISYCWHQKLRILVGANWWCQWWDGDPEGDHV